MDKFAQERGFLNKLREKINMPGGYLEGFFKPELDRIMADLKSRDDQIRSILSGKQIGGADAPSDGSSAKDLLKSSRKNFNRREYMTGIAELGKFHKKMFEVAKLISQFKIEVNKIHHKFLFEGVDDKRLQDLKQHMSSLPEIRRAELEFQGFTKRAGLIDDVINFASKRGRSLMAWERKYPKELKEIREGSAVLVNEAQKLLDNTLTYLKEMGTARAIRRPDDYMNAANKIVADFNKFDVGDKGFRAFYQGPVSHWLKIKEDIESQQNKGQPSAGGATQADQMTGLPKSDKVELGEEPTISAPSTPAPVPPVIPVTTSPVPADVPPMPGATQAPPQPHTPEEAAPDTVRSPPVVAHQKFYDSLEALSGEDPRILAKYISKYAASIQGSDPETAIKLFKISKNIKG
jgi:hypothetical protein